MGMPAARLGDICTGHECWPPRPTAQASTTVFVNQRGSHRMADAWSGHCCGPSCHSSTTVKGSTTVFVDGKPAARVGDQVGCGSVIMTGSGNVFIG